MKKLIYEVVLKPLYHEGVGGLHDLVLLNLKTLLLGLLSQKQNKS